VGEEYKKRVVIFVGNVSTLIAIVQDLGNNARVKRFYFHIFLACCLKRDKIVGNL
jgi:hypothetical protein